MVRLPFRGLPLAAVLPPLTLLVLLVPTSADAREFTAEPQRVRSGLRWVADEPPAHRPVAEQAVADQAVAAPPTIPAPPPPIPSSPPLATRSGLVWTVEDETTPLLAVDGERESEQSLTDPPQTDRNGEAPLAEVPDVDPPSAVQVPAIASGPSRATPSRLVWTAEDEPTPLVGLDPGLKLPQSLAGSTPDPTKDTTDLAEGVQASSPIRNGLRWEVDDEFSALVAANPASSPVELLAAAARSVIAVETVVEQLELASHHPSFSPEDIASLLLQPESPGPIVTDASPLNPADELISIDSSILPTTESENEFIANNDFIAIKQGSPDTDSQTLQTGLIAVNSGGIKDQELNIPQLTMPSGQSNRSISQVEDHSEHSQIKTSATVDSGQSSTTSRQLPRQDHFPLEPILLSSSVRSNFRQSQAVRASNLNPLIPSRLHIVDAGRPVRRASRVASLGIGFQLLSW